MRGYSRWGGNTYTSCNTCPSGCSDKEKEAAKLFDKINGKKLQHKRFAHYKFEPTQRSVCSFTGRLYFNNSSNYSMQTVTFDELVANYVLEDVEVKGGTVSLAVCECGAEKTGCLHSTWCPKYQE